MEITIKKIGKTWGTVGWLANGIENRTIGFKEGKQKNGKHGIWMYDKDTSYFLAGFDPYNINGYGGHPMKYELYYGTGETSAFDMGTPAFNRTLKTLAKNWCEELNEEMEDEQEIGIKLLRVSASD